MPCADCMDVRTNDIDSYVLHVHFFSLSATTLCTPSYLYLNRFFARPFLLLAFVLLPNSFFLQAFFILFYFGVGGEEGGAFSLFHPYLIFLHFPSLPGGPLHPAPEWEKVKEESYTSEKVKEESYTSKRRKPEGTKRKKVRKRLYRVVQRVLWPRSLYVRYGASS